MSKWLYNFTITKREQIVTEEVSKNKDGEETTTKKKETVEKEIPLKLKKPNRRLYDEADLFYGVKLSEGIKAGLLTKTLLAKRYENDGGPMSNPEKEEYANLYIELYDKENLVQKIQLNLEKEPEETRREKLKDALVEMSIIKQKLHQFEMSQQSLFDQTAEVRARNQTIMWWVLHLAHIEEKEGSVEEFFKGETFDERLEHYDVLEEDENPFWSDAIRKFIYFVSFWESGQLSSEEDFKKADDMFDKTLEEGNSSEEEQEEMAEEEVDEIADEILSNKVKDEKQEEAEESKPKAKAKKKTRKKEPIPENA